MLTISLYNQNKFEDDFFINYSKFKHGSKTQAREFGKQVSRVVNFENVIFPDENNKKVVFYSAPFNNIHTASNAFMDYLLSFLGIQFLEKGISVKQGKINRKYSYDDDYGNMSKEERRKAISSDLFTIDKTFIDENDVLVFVDDIKITGAHEERIKDLLEREGIKNTVVFIYIAQYTGEDPTIEHRLNHAFVDNLKKVNDIIRNEEFIFNTRITKYILNADIEHFISFITYQSQSFKETLFALSILNEYHNNKKYKSNFNILKDILFKDSF